MLEKSANLESRYLEIEQQMADPATASDFGRLAKLAKEHASLEAAVTSYREYRKVLQAEEEARSILNESQDAELTSLAKEELETQETRRLALEEELKMALLPRDPQDDRDIIVEIRAATGGDEAALFVAELYRMYSRFVQSKGWTLDLIDARDTGIGGFKEIVFEVKGQGTYSLMKHESGVHRVQRVPVTESSGRLHTSTATVAVLPEAEAVEVDVKDEDLRIDIFHAGGHGGQNVNKVATAVRITHIPSGIVAICQDERSQLRNKQKAMAVLNARLLDRAQKQQQSEISSDRRSQVGTGERSEKARTYNFPQDRVTDHRIGLTRHNLQTLLDGDLTPLIEPLMAWEQEQRLKQALE